MCRLTESATYHKDEVLGRRATSRQTLRLLTRPLIVEHSTGHFELTRPVNGPRAVDVVLVADTRLQRCTTQTWSHVIPTMCWFNYYFCHKLSFLRNTLYHHQAKVTQNTSYT